MFCENCGANVPDNAKFCTGCGANLESAAPAAPIQQPVQTAAPIPPPPQQQQQQFYNQAAGYGADQTNRKPLSVGNYIVMFILCAIPIVGFICLLVWAFGSGTNMNKKNYARAALILSLIVVAIWIVIFIVGGAAAGSFLNGLINSGYY